MDAILAIIADGGQAFVDIDIEVEDGRIKLISNTLYTMSRVKIGTVHSNYFLTISYQLPTTSQILLASPKKLR
jgi:hypothetical protein